jgi:hypothetical protein
MSIDFAPTKHWPHTSARCAGLPTELIPDEPVPDDAMETLTGVEIRRVTDAGPPMDVADTLVELIGNTPMLRLDRQRRGYNCIFGCPDKSNAEVGMLSQRRRDELRRVVRSNRVDRGAVGQGRAGTGNRRR